MAPTHSCQQKSSTEPRLLHPCGHSVVSQYSCQGNIRHVHSHWPMLCLHPTAWLLVESIWRAWTSTHTHISNENPTHTAELVSDKWDTWGYSIWTSTGKRKTEHQPKSNILHKLTQNGLLTQM